MTDPQMTFIEAVAWIATRDSRFSDTCRDKTHRRLAISLAIRKSGGEVQYRSIDSAEKALLAKCRSRKITATGLRGDISGPTAKRRTRITDIEWIDIRGTAAEDARTGRLMLVSKVGDEYWHELTFTRAEVLAEFPVRTEQAQSQIPPSGVVREAIKSGDLKQKAEEAPPVSPEPATPNDKPTSAPATEPPATAAEVPANLLAQPRRTESPASENHPTRLSPPSRKSSLSRPKVVTRASRSVRTSRD